MLLQGRLINQDSHILQAKGVLALCCTKQACRNQALPAAGIWQGEAIQYDMHQLSTARACRGEIQSLEPCPTVGGMAGKAWDSSRGNC